ncbi:MAG: sigma 54-interacting transcriptional regulator [Bacteroidota bacterium]
MNYPALGHYEVFIVVDNPMYQHLLSNILEVDDNCEIHLFDSGKECFNALKHQPDIILVDSSVPDVKIKRFCTELKKYDSRTEIVVLLEKDDVQQGTDLVKKGAYDYILKDVHFKIRFTAILERLTEKLALLRSVRQLHRELNERFTLTPGVRNASDSINEILDLATKASQSNINAIITGETGTDKVEIAKRIHYNSARKFGPFVVVDVGTNDEDETAIELFGAEAEGIGHLTKKKKGLFEEARGGTIYIDNINLASSKLQAKLSKFFKNNQSDLSAANSEDHLDIRYIIGATKSLIGEVKNGKFREDLYYQLIGINIDVKPLRERAHDIVLLADYYLNKFCEENDILPKKITSDAVDKLINYDFPGNLSELKGIIRLAAVLSDTDEIAQDHIQFNNTRTLSDFFRKEMTMKEYKAFIVQYYLEMYDNDIPLIAQKLNIGTATIYRMKKEWELASAQ